jgi:hypothetical protein
VGEIPPRFQWKSESLKLIRRWGLSRDHFATPGPCVDLRLPLQVAIKMISSGTGPPTTEAASQSKESELIARPRSSHREAASESSRFQAVG